MDYMLDLGHDFTIRLSEVSNTLAGGTVEFEGPEEWGEPKFWVQAKNGSVLPCWQDPKEFHEYVAKRVRGTGGFGS